MYHSNSTPFGGIPSTMTINDSHIFLLGITFTMLQDRGWKNLVPPISHFVRILHGNEQQQILSTCTMVVLRSGYLIPVTLVIPI